MLNKVCTVCGLEFPNHKMSCKSTHKEYRLPTAEEFLKDNLSNPKKGWGEKERLIEFTKLHLEAQREAIKKELEEGLETFGVSLVDDFKLEQTGNSLIDDAYPLDLIK